VQTVDESASPIVGPELAAVLTRATPRLQQLEVWGRRVFDGLAHPALRSLRLTGSDAVGALLADSGDQLPSVGLLDLAFCVERDASPWGVDAYALPTARLPKLRRLDLSRNEPGFLSPHYLGGSYDPFAFLAQLDVRSKLTHVRLPSVRSQAQADLLDSAVRSMPLLRELAIVRAYRGLGSFHMPRLAQLPEPWPWPPADQARALVFATVASASHPLLERTTQLDLPLPPMVVWLEQHFEQLPPPARGGWRELFELLEQSRHHAQISARVLRAMLQELELSEGVDPWIQLRDAVRADDDVVILFAPI
jgi:hypothetical protein